jgi:hypothetical protein
MILALLGEGGWSEGKSYEKRNCLFHPCAMFITLCFYAEAQQPIPKIGFLGATSSSSVTDRSEAFRQALREENERRCQDRIQFSDDSDPLLNERQQRLTEGEARWKR